MRHPLLFLSLFFLFAYQARSQENFIITGTVKDAETGETLPFANVFFAETTYGVNTDTEGNFRLVVPQAGTYDLIVRFVGYETYGLNMRLEEEKEIRLDVNLRPEQVNLGSFTLTAKKDEEWQRYLKEFKELFLGYSKNASQCKILNEDVLNFYFDRKENTLYAFAKEAIQVENKALGYKIDYHLEEFRIEYSKGLNTYYGFTVFTEMEGSKRREQRWEENRQIAYEGSLQHFFSTVFEGKLEEEGYIVQLAQDVEGFGRVLNPQKVNLKDWLDEGETTLSRRLPFDNYLYVTYTKEKESPEFVQNFKPGGRLNSVSASDLGQQVSWISLVEGKNSIEFEGNGYVYDPISFYSAGYWGFEKVADMVPLNYKPRQ